MIHQSRLAQAGSHGQPCQCQSQWLAWGQGCPVGASESGLDVGNVIMTRDIRYVAPGPAVTVTLQPTTGRPATGELETVTVTAATCLDANAFSTAAVVWGERRALSRIAEHGWSARAICTDGSIVTAGPWPSEETAA